MNDFPALLESHPRRGRGEHLRSALPVARRRWLLYAPASIAAFYLVALGFRLSAFLLAIQQNSDAVSSQQLTKMLSAQSGAVRLGNSSWYSTFLFNLVTRDLPGYRTIWALGPLVVAAIMIAAIAATARRVGGRWAGAVTAALLICCSPQLLTLLGQMEAHLLTWCSAALLFAGLVFLLDETKPAPGKRHVIVAAALGLFVALNLASDPLLYFAGVVPVMVAAVVARRCFPSARTASALRLTSLCVALAIGCSRVVIEQMHAHNVSASGLNPIHLTAASSIRVHLWEWLQGMWRLTGGDDFGSAALVLLSVVAAGLAISAVLVVLSALRRYPSRFEASAAQDGDGVVNASARVAYVTAWVLSGLLVSAAFVMSTAPAGDTAQRYIVGVPIALAALLPLVARRRWAVLAVSAAASVYCLSGVASVATMQTTDGKSLKLVATQVAALARREHLTYGYGDYWDTVPLTLDSNFKLSAYPVQTCGKGLCRFNASTLASYYKVRPHTRSFLLSDTRAFFLDRIPKTLGRPAATFQINSQYRLLVYNYDIASRIRA